METPTEGPGAAASGASTVRFAGAAALLLFSLAAGAVAVEYKAMVQEASQPASAASAVSPFTDVPLIGKAAIVVDIKTGKILYERNADTQLSLASLTKVPLALVVAENVPMDALIAIPRGAIPPGKGKLSAGEQWSVADILDLTLVASWNDGAEMLAAAVEGPVRARYPEAAQAQGATLWRMNDLVRSLGLSRTYFLNVTGLDVSDTQSGAYGSARDMAKLFAYAASAQPALFERTAKTGILLTSEDGKNSANAVNTNEAQGAIAGLILGKTGFTDLAGGNLGIVFDVGIGRPVVAIVLGSTYEGRFEDMQKLVKAAREALARE